jgi:hypothetical protein
VCDKFSFSPSFIFFGLYEFSAVLFPFKSLKQNFFCAAQSAKKIFLGSISTFSWLFSSSSFLDTREGRISKKKFSASFQSFYVLFFSILIWAWRFNGSCRTMPYERVYLRNLPIRSTRLHYFLWSLMMEHMCDCTLIHPYSRVGRLKIKRRFMYSRVFKPLKRTRLI